MTLPPQATSGDLQNGSSTGTGSSSAPIGDTARELAEQAKREGAVKADALRSSTSHKVNAIAEGARAAAGALKQEDVTQMSQYLERFAGSLQQLSGTIRDKSGEELLQEANRLARENPTMFMTACVAIGFGLGRFAKAAPPGQREADSTASTTDTSGSSSMSGSSLSPSGTSSAGTGSSMGTGSAVGRSTMGTGSSLGSGSSIGTSPSAGGGSSVNGLSSKGASSSTGTGSSIGTGGTSVGESGSAQARTGGTSAAGSTPGVSEFSGSSAGPGASSVGEGAGTAGSRLAGGSGLAGNSGGPEQRRPGGDASSKTGSSNISNDEAGGLSS